MQFLFVIGSSVNIQVLRIMSEILIEAAKKEDLAEAAQVLSIAIAPTLNSIALWGGDSEKHRSRIEKTLLVILKKNPFYKTVLARNAGKIVGVHSMLPWPHCQPTFWEGLKLTPWLFPITRWAGVRGMSLQFQSSRLDPHHPHWHLGPIGVLAEARGLGIGRLLVTHVLEEFDHTGTPAYLETDQYTIVKQEELLGFKVIGEARILGIQNWLMWRSAQTDESSHPDDLRVER
jgi:ribosomal protein S18 acetylase RimI-like enzyme